MELRRFVPAVFNQLLQFNDRRNELIKKGLSLEFRDVVDYVE